MSSMCRILLFAATLLFWGVLTASETAIFAGGCFWCTEHDFKQLPGILSVVSGYCGGTEPNPTYKMVSTGKTGYVESIKVTYDPKEITYSQLLDFYWRNIDPTRDDGQFCDYGRQYRPVIFYLNEEQKKRAQASKEKISIEPNKVDILPATTFYPAEEYHQNYAEKNPLRYRIYRYRCGRDKRLKALWGKD